MSTTKGKNILIVDDDEDLTNLFQTFLEYDGYRVDAFTDPIDALYYFRKNTYDLGLLDLKMPKMNGMEFKKAIDKDLGLRGKSIPFIFATTAPVKPEITEAYEYRVQGYFRKPNTTEEQADMLDIIIKYWIISIHPNKDVDVHASRQTVSKRTTA